VLFYLLATAAVVAIAVNAHAAHRARMRAVEATLEALGGTVTEMRLDGKVTGALGGLTLRFQLKAPQRNTPRRTHCWVDVPDDVPPFEMDLRPQTAFELRAVEHGRAIDLVLGDEAFDDEFIVEAAPASIAHEVLDRNARTALLAFAPCNLTLRRGELHFEKNGYLDDPAEIRRVLELCTAMVTRLRSLLGELRERNFAAAAQESPDGYRGPSPQTLPTLAVNANEMAELAALHRVRSARNARKTVLLLVAVVAAFVLFGALRAFR
jgi:hypothetical protein